MVGLDITEGKRIVEALAESEARFKAIFENNALGMMMIDLLGRSLPVGVWPKKSTRPKGQRPHWGPTLGINGLPLPPARRCPFCSRHSS